jgi:hypothetical protein
MPENYFQYHLLLFPGVHTSAEKFIYLLSCNCMNYSQDKKFMLQMQMHQSKRRDAISHVLFAIRERDEKLAAFLGNCKYFLLVSALQSLSLYKCINAGKLNVETYYF